MSSEVTIKEGIAKKRSGPMHQWTSRYFILTKNKISYKIKQDSSNFKNSYDLLPSCRVMKIKTESRIQGKKMYSFWIIWPGEKNNVKIEEENTQAIEGDSDGEGQIDGLVSTDDADVVSKAKTIKSLVQSEVMTQKRQKEAVNEQYELHRARDTSVNLGAKVAAVALGGVVVGALTAGLGLIPYVTIVGLSAVAGGGAVALQWKKPLDSRLIMAFDSMKDAEEWKSEIERQIHNLNDNYFPSSIDPKVISAVLDRTTFGGTWKRVAIVEGVRILEHALPLGFYKDSISKLQASQEGALSESTLLHECMSGDCMNSIVRSRCRKGQITLRAIPANIMVALMSNVWPKNGSFKPVENIDSHLDIIGVEVITDCRPTGGSNTIHRKLSFQRFWQKDEFGVFFISYNIKQHDGFEMGIKKSESAQYKTCAKEAIPSIDAVITIAPRLARHSNSFEETVVDYSDSETEVLVTVIVQASTTGNWAKGEMAAFLDNFLQDHLLELRYTIMNHKFTNAFQSVLCNEEPIVSTLERRESRDESIKEPVAPQKETQIELLISNKSKASRGITTIQPGLEDLSTDSLDFNEVSVIPPPVDHSTYSPPHPPLPPSDNSTRTNSSHRGGMLGIFSRKHKAQDDNGLTDNSISRPPLLRNRSLTDDRVGKTRSFSPETARNRLIESPKSTHKQINPNDNNSTTKTMEKQAEKKLRHEIMNVEQDLLVLNKKLSKKTVLHSNRFNSSTPNSEKKHFISQDEYDHLLNDQKQLQERLQEARQQYVDLTGRPYEKNRSTLHRLRALGGRSSFNKNLSNDPHHEALVHALLDDDTTTVTKNLSAKLNAVASTKSIPLKCIRPLHWISCIKYPNANKLWPMIREIIGWFVHPMLRKYLWLAMFSSDEELRAIPMVIRHHATILANTLWLFAFVFLWLTCAIVHEQINGFMIFLTSNH